jgi:hypothetical protein
MKMGMPGNGRSDRDFVDISAIEAGKLTLDLQETDLNSLARFGVLRLLANPST